MKNIMMIIVALIFVSCSSSETTFSKGSYGDANEETLLNDKFNEKDVQIITHTMVESLSKCAQYNDKKPRVMLGEIANHTSEHMDLQLILNKLRVAMIKNQSLTFVNTLARRDISSEMEYQRNGSTSSSAILKNDQQMSPEYRIDGDIHSNEQTVGDQKIIYYYITLQMTDLESSLITCTEEKELKKHFEKIKI